MILCGHCRRGVPELELLYRWLGRLLCGPCFVRAKFKDKVRAR